MAGCEESMTHTAPMSNGTFFFSNKDCTYFPCHRGIDPECFNCLFCYCPLYALGDECGGEFTYTRRGYKDCSKCTVMHEGCRGIELVREKFVDLSIVAWEHREIA